ncbi:MAG: glycosyltransferase [Sphaerospermopsis sp. SIO1G2]|nr:glycosyltransferase [Sphaerospermopsis sp. SIO1G2]
MRDDAQPVTQFMHQRFGDMLLQQRLVPKEILLHALRYQRQYGGKLGDILACHGRLPLLLTYRLLARHHGMAFLNLMETQADKSVMDEQHIADYIQEGVVPVRREDGRLLVATCNPANYEQLSALFPGENLSWYTTSPRDIAWLVQHHHHEKLVHQASESLCERAPHYALRQSSRPRYASSVWRSSVVISIVAFIAGVALLYPSLLVNICLAVMSIFFLATIMLKVCLLLVGKRARTSLQHLCDVPMIADDELPIYTVLLPLFQEASSVAGIIASIERIDYPRSKLDVKFITEADDEETIRAIKAAMLPTYIDLITVPYAAPQTKPKACNYAMHFAKGEFVGIYDAEDVPDPQQLRRSVALFRHYPHVSCLQGQLNFYNARENWLTSCFALEYAGLFSFMLPALYRLHIPIPLGGTSNHIRCTALDDLGAWDAYNVTEDADLGICLASEGHITLPLPSVTFEEAPVSLVAWIKQRSRWIKGYLQTWSVLSRHSSLRYERLGAIGFWGIHFFIGAASLNYIISPFLWGGALLWMMTPSHLVALHPFILAGCVAVMCSGVLMHWFSALYVRSSLPHKVRWSAIFAYPLYYILHSVAGLRALYQLIMHPYYWEKTTHGVSKISRPLDNP